MNMATKWPIGTFINMATVLVGSTIGVLLQQAFPENIKAITFQAIGLGTLLIGIMMSLKLPPDYILLLIFSLIIGGITGELIHLDLMLENAGDYVKHLLNIGSSTFTEGLLTAFIIFCVGSITIVGAIEEGVQGKRDLLIIKSLLDGITSIALASTYGIGVLFSIFPMLILQGGITVSARRARHFFNETVIAVMSSVGGLLIIGIGINLLRIGEINIENLLPALVFASAGAWVWPLFTKNHRNI